MNQNTIGFRNSELEMLHEFLIGINLKGRKSRSRSLLCKKIQDKFKERSNHLTEIQKVYAKLNEEGEMVTDDNGVIAFSSDDKQKLCVKEINELDQEYSVIDCIEIIDHMKNLLDSLNELDEDLNGSKAVSYDVVCEQLETLKFEKESE